MITALIRQMPETIEDPAAVPWICAALVIGVAMLWAIGRRK